MAKINPQKRISVYGKRRVENFAKHAQCSFEEAAYLMGSPGFFEGTLGRVARAVTAPFKVFGTVIYAFLGILMYWWGSLVLLFASDSFSGRGLEGVQTISFGLLGSEGILVGPVFLVLGLFLVFGLQDDGGKGKILDMIMIGPFKFMAISTGMIMMLTFYLVLGLSLILAPFMLAWGTSGAFSAFATGPHAALLVISGAFIFGSKVSDR